MKLLPKSTTFLFFLLLLVELPILSMSRPTPMRLHKDGLTKLFRQLHRLLNLAQEVLNHLGPNQPYEDKLTTLPTINFRPTDLVLVEANSTLSQLSLGMHSFKLHFDWLLYWQNQSGLMSPKTKQITDQIHSINILVDKQTQKSVVQDDTLHLPPPTSAWDINKKSAVFNRKLKLFCDWYLRALKILIHHAEKQRH